MKTCSIENCDNPLFAKTFCSRHYQQMYLHGKIKRTKMDSNDFIIGDTICWIILKNIKCIEVARAKFYTKYYEQIKDYKWHLTSDGYVEGVWYDKNTKKQTMSLHAAIIYLSGQEVKDGKIIDHKDRDPLNNLDNNLRICNYLENGQNKGKNINNTSGYKCVSWHKRMKKWISYIIVNYNRIHLGYFDTKEDAARAYNAAAIKYFGEFAVLNDIS